MWAIFNYVYATYGGSYRTVHKQCRYIKKWRFYAEYCTQIMKVGALHQKVKSISWWKGPGEKNYWHKSFVPGMAVASKYITENRSTDHIKSPNESSQASVLNNAEMNLVKWASTNVQYYESACIGMANGVFHHTCELWHLFTPRQLANWLALANNEFPKKHSHQQ